ncbi:MAG: serine protein kinase RIO [Candidatus Marsarchaeota archaeon]|nr:serine protein kinase RIO [Candidatus Marsarchaeota archaeon]
MARRRSREKQPSREKQLLNEQLKIEEGIFDNRTMLRIGKLFNKGVLASMEFIIARGKEADVYLADAGEKVGSPLLALKVFRLENARFQNRVKYIDGDPRFGKVKGSVFAIVSEWCKKEYGNLLVAEAAGIHAPKPYAFSGNVLAMEFLGEEGKPAMTLREEELEDPEKTLATVLEDTRRLYAHELVHADLSEYNILLVGGEPYMIDFGQAVHIKHPDASRYLERDIFNILHYFEKKYGIEKESSDVLDFITAPA